MNDAGAIFGGDVFGHHAKRVALVDGMLEDHLIHVDPIERFHDLIIFPADEFGGSIHEVFQ